MIQIHELQFEYPGSDFRLQIQSLEVEAGRKTALVGPSMA
jgi:ABC-type transport system involved in cytochrome bd biosynthesis fused ATPase/permease subunit